MTQAAKGLTPGFLDGLTSGTLGPALTIVVQVVLLLLGAALVPLLLGVLLFSARVLVHGFRDLLRAPPSLAEGSIDLFGLKLTGRVREEVALQRATQETDRAALLELTERIERTEHEVQSLGRQIRKLFHLLRESSDDEDRHTA